jgi:phage shock protein PspC (stress-responsive transcriptional regulator)
MVRSFTDRIFGGVCGGLAARLPLPAWGIRLLFIALTILGLGFGLLLYLALWWALPQESLITERRGGWLRLLFAVVIAGALAAIWIGWRTGDLVGPDDQSLVIPALLVVMSSVYFLRQVRAAS